MKTILTLASLLGSLLLLAIAAYAYSNESGHSGANPYCSLFLFVPLLLIGLAAIRNSCMRKQAIAAVGIATLSIVFVLILDRTNTLLEYGKWIERGMPEKGKMSPTKP